jgi:hypothetical protein
MRDGEFVGRGVLVTGYKLQVSGYQLLVAGYWLQVAGYRLLNVKGFEELGGVREEGI